MYLETGYDGQPKKLVNTEAGILQYIGQVTTGQVTQKATLVTDSNSTACVTPYQMQLYDMENAARTATLTMFTGKEVKDRSSSTKDQTITSVKLYEL